QQERIQQCPQPVSSDRIEGRGHIINTRRIVARCWRAKAVIRLFLPSRIYLARGKPVVKRSHLIVVQEHVMGSGHSQFERTTPRFRSPNEEKWHDSKSGESYAQEADEKPGLAFICRGLFPSIF